MKTRYLIILLALFLWFAPEYNAQNVIPQQSTVIEKDTIRAKPGQHSITIEFFITCEYDCDTINKIKTDTVPII